MHDHATFLNQSLLQTSLPFCKGTDYSPRENLNIERHLCRRMRAHSFMMVGKTDISNHMAF